MDISQTSSQATSQPTPRARVHDLLRRGESRLRLQTIVRLRWLAVLGQSLTVVFVFWILGIDLPIGACLAVISRATSAVAARGAEKAAEELRVARAFVRSARHRMVGHLKEMDKNRDAEQTAISETAYSALGYGFSFWE